MNLPNKLTLFRIILIPFLYFSLHGMCGRSRKIYCVRYICSSKPDRPFDGKIARKYNLVTNFGKFMDPIADKLLVSSALISFVGLNRLQAWIVIILIAREFIISGFRLVASDSGIVLAASWWGKFKTAFQMIMCILLIINIQNNVLR